MRNRQLREDPGMTGARPTHTTSVWTVVNLKEVQQDHHHETHVDDAQDQAYQDVSVHRFKGGHPGRYPPEMSFYDPGFSVTTITRTTISALSKKNMRLFN